MYYVVTQKQQGNAAVDILARCRTARGALRRLNAIVEDYRRSYGYNTIFPARPWIQMSDALPEKYDPDAAWYAYSAIEDYRDEQDRRTRARRVG